MGLLYWSDLQEAIYLFAAENATWFFVVFIMVVLDIISKLIYVFIWHDFSSQNFRKGLGRKLSYLIILCGVAVIQVAMFDSNFDITIMGWQVETFPAFGIVCGGIILSEFSSIVENVCLLNPKLNSIVGKFFSQDDANQYTSYASMEDFTQK